MYVPHKRRKNAGIYSNNLKTLDAIIKPLEKDYARHIYHLYVIRVKSRDKLKAFLRENGVSTGIHYPIPLHKQPVYVDMKLWNKRLPVSEACSRDILSLPMYPELEESQIEEACSLIKRFQKVEHEIKK